MRWSRSYDDGFGLLEVVIAMFLLAIIAAAILPAMWNGIRYSSEQASVATATRQLNSLVEQARQSTRTCVDLTALGGTRTFEDGAGQTYTASTTVTDCSDGGTGHIEIVATNGTSTLATVDALIYVPGGTP